MFVSLLLPSLLFMAIAVLVTRVLERFVPETIPGLAVLALISSLVMLAFATGFFAVIYALRLDGSFSYLGSAGGIAHMLGLGAKAALVWLPLVLLTVATAPRRWKTNIW